DGIAIARACRRDLVAPRESRRQRRPRDHHGHTWHKSTPRDDDDDPPSIPPPDLDLLVLALARVPPYRQDEPRDGRRRRHDGRSVLHLQERHPLLPQRPAGPQLDQDRADRLRSRGVPAHGLLVPRLGPDEQGELGGQEQLRIRRQLQIAPEGVQQAQDSQARRRRQADPGKVSGQLGVLPVAEGLLRSDGADARGGTGGVRSRRGAGQRQGGQGRGTRRGRQERQLATGGRDPKRRRRSGRGDEGGPSREDQIDRSRARGRIAARLRVVVLVPRLGRQREHGQRFLLLSGGPGPATEGGPRRLLLRGVLGEGGQAPRREPDAEIPQRRPDDALRRAGARFRGGRAHLGHRGGRTRFLLREAARDRADAAGAQGTRGGRGGERERRQGDGRHLQGHVRDDGRRRRGGRRGQPRRGRDAGRRDRGAGGGRPPGRRRRGSADFRLERRRESGGPSRIERRRRRRRVAHVGTGRRGTDGEGRRGRRVRCSGFGGGGGARRRRFLGRRFARGLTAVGAGCKVRASTVPRSIGWTWKLSVDAQGRRFDPFRWHDFGRATSKNGPRRPRPKGEQSLTKVSCVFGTVRFRAVRRSAATGCWALLAQLGFFPP
ncbi:hypothetical protein ACHAWF_012081, partial [Thalassiosira exigua]